MRIIQGIRERLPSVKLNPGGGVLVSIQPPEVRRRAQEKSASKLLRLIASNTFNLFNTDSYEGFIWQHNTHIWVYRCIRVLVNAAIRVRPQQVRRYVQKGIKKEEALPYDHPAVTILQNPNIEDTAADLIEKIIVSWNLTGIYYLVYEPSTHELWHLRSDRVTINPDRNKYIKDFTYTVNYEPITYPREDVVYDKYYNPNDDYYGLSPLQAARNSINSHLRAQSWNLNFFKNSAMPAGLLTSEYPFSGADDPMLKLIKAEWTKLYGGWERHGSVAVMGGGLKYDPISPTHDEMNFIELLDKSRDEIFAALGVPKIFANAKEAENYSNLTGYFRMVWYQTLIPAFIKISQTYDKYLNQRFAERGEYIHTKFDYSQVEELQEDVRKDAEASRTLVLSGQRLINEAREKRGEPPIEGGDTTLIPMSMVPLAMAGRVLDGKVPATGQTPSKKAATYIKSIRPTREERLRHWTKTKAIVTANEQKMIRVLIAIFTDWQEEMLRNLPGDKSVKAIDVDSVLFDVEGAKEMLLRAGGPLLEDSIKKGGKRVLSSINSTVSFDLHDPRVEKLLKEAKQRFAEEIAEGHWKRMKDSLSEGIREGENSRQLAERVRETMGHEINNAPTVARTEINPRYQEGQLEGMRQSGVAEGKEWLPAFSENSREEHLAADGQQVGLDDSFEVGGEYLQYPGDPSGSAENIINCICDLLIVLKEE